MPLLHPRWSAAALSGACALGGCIAYTPEPIDAVRVSRSLAVPDLDTLQVRASQFSHPLVRPVVLDLRDGLSPDEAAIVAVLVNPSLRAQRDRRSVAGAQLFAAGILPNPQLGAGIDVPTGVNPPGTVAGFSVGPSWDFTSLVAHGARIAAARAGAASVALDVAWQEWQVAEAARMAVWKRSALDQQLAAAEEAFRALADDLNLVARAVNQHEKTLVDLAAADASTRSAHEVVMAITRRIWHQELVLDRALGLPPNTPVALERDIELPSGFGLPAVEQLLDGLEARRLDLLALRQGYASQEAAVRVAILEQFPRINLGFHRASDTSNIHTVGLGVSIDLPLFDRNQGKIAFERATRRRLFDEYVERLFEARSDVVTSLADIVAITAQIAAAEASLPALARLVSVYGMAVQQGNGDVLSYYIARGNLAQKRLDILVRKEDLVDNRVALEIAAGWELPEERRSAGGARGESPP